ncbi:response regulator [Actinomadura rubrisoli]|uniref:response regulator n=1 Tax=Actinomadura rubrisoli TaxID=2530368 RepID=UPI001FB6F906|nr:response regulator transcription factor [Actinomadura rubrisoli]
MLTVLLVDDHTLVRQGVREILETQEDLRVVAEAGDGEEAVAAAAASRPHVVLLDVEMPGTDAAATVRRIRACSPDSQVIILSMHEGPRLLEGLLDAGIRGYLLKTVPWEELVAAIRAVRDDGSRIVLGVSRRSLPRGERSVRLTERERQVLALTARALSNRQIASRLSLTEATVKRHLRSVFAKLGAGSRLDAVNRAVAAGLIEPEL